MYNTIMSQILLDVDSLKICDNLKYEYKSTNYNYSILYLYQLQTPFN